MKKLYKGLFLSFVFSMFAMPLIAQQYGPQFDNPGFEDWTTREIVTVDEIRSVSEPVHWHSGGTATGTWSSLMPHSVEQSGHTRPGSSGSKSVKMTPSTVWGVTANGTMTNGRINAGSTSPSGSSNYDYTQRAQNAFNTPITQLPDSLTIWVCFRSSSTSDKAQVKAVVHGDADYKVIADGTENPANMHVATADHRFTRTAPSGGSYSWTRLSIPFVNNGPCTDVRYILFIANTNETPGAGNTSDDLFVDDVLLVYNPTLTLGQLTSTNYAPNDAITIPFTLTGTMSPDNLNTSANQVIAELSNANGSFNNPTVLGSVTTNTSGSITATIPNLSDGQYQIRVRSTNYPLIGQNIQTLSITSPIQTYVVSVSAAPTDGGTVSGGGEYQQGQNCTVTATANTNYTFTNWTENGSVVSTNASYTFTVNGNRNLVANYTYVPPTYTVSVSATPTDGGTVSGGGEYQQGQNCTVTATANTNYTFTNWTENGSVVSTNASYTFTVNGNRSLVANFTYVPPTYTVSVSANPSDGGTVTGGGSYTEGSSCTVTATANTNYTFTNWTENGSVVSTNASYTFTVNSNRNLVANFTYVPPTYTVNVSANPNNGGTVTGGGSYTEGAFCTVTATANTNYTLTNWTENGNVVSTNASYTFPVNGNHSLVANFTYVLPTYTVSVSANPSDGGTVTGGGSYTEGTSCTVTATANSGYTFVNWTENGNQVSANASYTFIVNGNRNLVAHFSTQSYVITAMADPEEGGTVSGSGGYNFGDICTLTATANTGYAFVNWTKNGDILTTESTLSFSVNESGTYIAHFQILTYTINVAADPEEGGVVSGDGRYDYGRSCTITAMSNENYQFINWTKDGVEVSTESIFTFTVTDSATFVAHFRYYDKVDENIATSQIYPNPFASTVSIKAEKTIKSISVYDMFGQMVKEQGISDRVIDLDLSDLGDGAYLLLLDYGDCRSTHRIVKSTR